MTTYTSPFAGDVVLPTDVSYASYSISADLTLVWPINGNISTNVAARIMDITPSTSGLSVLMPPANQVSVGQDAFIKNPSAFTLTIKSSTGATLGTITAGGTRYFYITNNSTASGTWSNIALGIGTSSPDATTLAGYGLEAEGATLNQTAPVSSITAGYTFLSTDRAQTKLWSLGAGSATLPIASSLGNNWFCFFKNNGTGTLTISTTGINTLDLGASKSFQPNESCIIVCDGTNFVTVGYGVSTRFLFSSITKEVTAGAYSLSSTEGTSLIQEYVGTLSSNVTVTYPPVVAFYIVSNQVTAGGFSLTITTGVPGGADATVAAGNQSTLICDGVNFFNANTVQAGASVNALANGSAGSPSLYFASEVNTGVYRAGTGLWNVSILGTDRFEVNASGIDVNGTGTFSGGILGGIFT
jgi:hypothetical protein